LLKDRKKTPPITSSRNNNLLKEVMREEGVLDFKGEAEEEGRGRCSGHFERLNDHKV